MFFPNRQRVLPGYLVFPLRLCVSALTFFTYRLEVHALRRKKLFNDGLDYGPTSAEAV